MTARKKVVGSRKKDSELDFDSETFYNPESNENISSQGNTNPLNLQTPKNGKRLKKLSYRTNSLHNSEFDLEETLYGDENVMEQEKPKNKRVTNPDRLEVETNELAQSSDEDEETIKRNTENKRLRRLRKAETVAVDDSQMLLEENKSAQSEPKPEHHSCAICLSEITDVVAKLDCCTHVFCFSCIKEWSNVANQCPLCKNRFRRILRFSPDGSKLGDLRVKFKNQVAPEEPAYEIIENTDDYCYACGSDSNPLKMLVCDECNFYCCHIYCTDPPMHRVPLEPWYCSFCRPPQRPQATYRRSTTGVPESAVTQSIRKALGEGSILQKLFEKADKEMEKKLKTAVKRSSTSRSAERSKTPRGRTKQRSTTKSKSTKKTKGSPRERTRTKSRKPAVGKTGKKNKDKTKKTRSLSKVKKTKKTSGSRQGSGRKSY